MPAGRIAQRLELPGPTLSFHLAQLKSAGLVACRREGRSLIYSANFAAMRGLVDYLTENCCREAEVPCAPARARRPRDGAPWLRRRRSRPSAARSRTRAAP